MIRIGQDRVIRIGVPPTSSPRSELRCPRARGCRLIFIASQPLICCVFITDLASWLPRVISCFSPVFPCFSPVISPVIRSKGTQLQEVEDRTAILSAGMAKRTCCGPRTAAAVPGVRCQREDGSRGSRVKSLVDADSQRTQLLAGLGPWWVES